MNTRRRVKRGNKRLYKKTKKNIYGGTSEPHSKEEEEVNNEAHEEGEGEEGQEGEGGIPESPGIVKPLAYIALGIAEKGTALGVKKLGEILKIDITGKDIGKLLPAFNLSLEDPATRAEFARFLVNITDNVDFALQAMGPPIRKIVDKILDIADESGKKVVRTAAGVALEGATAIPVVGSGIGAFIVADNFVKLIQSAMSAFFGATSSSVVAVAEVNKNIKDLQEEKARAQERISDATSGFNNGLKEEESFLPTSKSEEKIVSQKKTVLQKQEPEDQEEEDGGGEDEGEGEEEEEEEKPEFLKQDPMISAKNQLNKQLERTKSDVASSLTAYKEKGTSLLDKAKSSVEKVANKAIDATGLDAPPPQTTLQKWGLAKKPEQDMSLGARANRLQNLSSGDLASKIDVNKGFSSAASLGHQGTDMAFQGAKSITQNLPPGQRFLANRALGMSKLGANVAISGTAMAGKTLGNYAKNQIAPPPKKKGLFYGGTRRYKRGFKRTRKL